MQASRTGLSADGSVMEEEQVLAVIRMPKITRMEINLFMVVPTFRC